ncbi:MAG: hypothetical protein ACOYIT_05110 [Christensenellales bacterium]
MAQNYDNMNFTELLFWFMAVETSMLNILEWLCNHMTEAEVSNKAGVAKHE